MWTKSEEREKEIAHIITSFLAGDDDFMAVYRDLYPNMQDSIIESLFENCVKMVKNELTKKIKNDTI